MGTAAPKDGRTNRALLQVIITCLILVLVSSSSSPREITENLLANSAFEEGMNRWSIYGATVSVVAEDGNRTLELRSAGQDSGDLAAAWQRVRLTPGRVYKVSGRYWPRSLNAARAGVALSFVDGKGRRVALFDVANFHLGLPGWETFSFPVTTPDAFSWAALTLFLQGEGQIFYDDLFVSLVASRSEGSRVFAPVPRLPVSLAPGSKLATGFSRVEKVGKRWWLVDAKGKPFWDRGVNWVAYPEGQAAQLNSGWTEAVSKEYPNKELWAQGIVKRLKRLGFTSAGAGAGSGRLDDNEIRLASQKEGGFFYYYIFDFTRLGKENQFLLKSDKGQPPPAGGTSSFPDPFDPGWRQEAERLIQRVTASLKDDPALVGYFVGNEESLASPTSPPLYNYIWSPYAAEEFLRWVKSKHGDDIGLVNRRWSSSYHRYNYSSFAEVLKDKPRVRGTDDPVRSDLELYERYMVKAFIDFTYDTLKRYDPNHLVISPRLVTTFLLDYPSLDLLSRYDLIAVNLYYHRKGGFLKEALQRLEKLYRITGKPLLITEWGAGAQDSGFGGTLASQRDRGELYRNGLFQLAGLPFVVGAHWHMLVDDESAGQNFGLQDSSGREYAEFVAEVEKANNAVNEGYTERLP